MFEEFFRKSSDQPARRVLVVCAHADDEALGCGGTIARIAAAGHRVRVVFLTDGVGARGAHEQAASARAVASAEAAKVLGIEALRQASFPDNQMDTVPLLSVIKAVEAEIADFSPQLVLTHSLTDLNVDHRVACQAVLTACRPTSALPVKAVLAFEVVSSTEWGFYQFGRFEPNLFIDISAQYPAKVAGLTAYAEEMRPGPHARSFYHVEALARHRGSTVGYVYAEAFQVIWAHV